MRDTHAILSIALDKRWSFGDLSDFPHIFDNLYAFFFALEKIKQSTGRDSIYHKRLGNFPWRGGYSTVNFFAGLERDVPSRSKTQVKSIKYSSPGLLEITLIMSAAWAVSRAVKTAAEASHQLHALYKNIQGTLREKKLTKIDATIQFADLDPGDKEYLETAFVELAKLNGFNKSEIKRLVQITPNALARIKLLMSVTRRTTKLAMYQNSGKARLAGVKAIKPKKAA